MDTSPRPPRIALSIKQPWATLLIAGVKSIEVRSWSAAPKGPLLIHAGRVPDDRSIGWDLLPQSHRSMADLRGGVIGEVHFTECRRYRTAAEFVADELLHRNDPSWFRPPGLYGFVMKEPRALPFFQFPGWFKFFEIPGFGA